MSGGESKKSEYDTGFMNYYLKLYNSDYLRSEPLFANLMNKLKTQMKKDWRNPWIDVSELLPNEKDMLTEMRRLQLVIEEGNRARLIQACDWTKLQQQSQNRYFDTPIFEEQMKQKEELVGLTFYRGTNVDERDNFTIGSSIMEGSQFGLERSFWAIDGLNNEYGLIQAETKASDILSIADVDLSTQWEKYCTKQLEEVFTECVNVMSSVPIFNINELLNIAMRENLIDNPELGDFISFDEIRDAVEELLDKLNSLKKNYSLDSFIKEHKTARHLLDNTDEICFVYHPWVTVEEIQSTRKYTTRDKLKRKKDTSAATGVSKRQRINLADIQLRF